MKKLPYPCCNMLGVVKDTAYGYPCHKAIAYVRKERGFVRKVIGIYITKRRAYLAARLFEQWIIQGFDALAIPTMPR